MVLRWCSAGKRVVANAVQVLRTGLGFLSRGLDLRLSRCHGMDRVGRAKQYNHAQMNLVLSWRESMLVPREEQDCSRDENENPRQEPGN